MKKILNLVLVVTIILLSTSGLFAQNKFYFGANTTFTDTTLNKLIVNNIPISLLRNQYHIDFLRYPGGTPTRYFLWDGNGLIENAMMSYSKRFSDKNQSAAKHIERMSKEISLPDSVYFKFLVFCKNNNIEPIIQLNTFSYVYQNTVYPIARLSYENGEPNNRHNKWNEIKKFISSQVLATHRYFDIVYWEIGNEDYYIYNPEVFGKIVSVYSKLIKDKYPQDKVIVPAASMNPHTPESGWTQKLFDYLESDSALGRIDFLAPHYYKDGNKEISDQKQLSRIIKRISISDRINGYKNLINGYSNKNIRLFFTEFSVFTNIKNINYNTQLHALLLCEYMMQFYSDPEVFGVIHHGFTQKSSALFFEKGVFNSLDYGIKPNTDNPNFYYMPPQAEMLRVLFKNIKGDNFKIVQRNDLTILISSSDKRQMVVLNYGDHNARINLNELAGQRFLNPNVVAYHFNDLSDHLWNPGNNMLNLNIADNRTNIPSHSLIFINY